MTYSRVFIIETSENPGEPSAQQIRAYPLSCQGVSATLKVSCSVSMRERRSPGTLFKGEYKADIHGIPSAKVRSRRSGI